MSDTERLGVGSWRLGLAAAFIATTLPFVFFYDDWWPLTAYFAFFATVALLNALYDPKDVRDRGTLRADVSGIAYLDRRFDVVAIRRARVRQVEKSVELDLDLGALSPPVRFRLRSADAARAIVRALALDASRARDHFRLTWGPATGPIFTGVLFFAGQLFVRGAASWSVILLVAAAAALFVTDRALHYADVGPDGVFIRKGLSRTHVRAREVLGVGHGKVTRGLVQLRLFRARELPVEFWLGTREAAAFEGRIAELRAGVATPGEAADCARVLQSLSLDELRTLAVRPETFRHAGIDRSTLEKLLQDPFAAPRSRLRAAIALGGGDQLRIAAEQTTIPELRIAFEQAQTDADTALETVDRIKG